MIVQPKISGKSVKKKLWSNLKIGQPNDRYEQEADHVADQVMKIPVSGSHGIQRKCAKCKEEELQMKPLETKISPIIQKQEEEEEEEEMLQMKGYDNKNNSISDLESSLQQSKGSGQNLDAATQSFMNKGIGTDFSNVKVHTDTRAVQMNQQLNAKAFTNGSDIYFNRGQYNPQSSEGKHLLAHELTHVVQQGGMKGPTVQLAFEANPELDIEIILGQPPSEMESLLFTTEQMQYLYEYLKKVRSYDPGKNQLALNTLELYFPENAINVWEDSKKALAGYSGMRVTGGKNRMKIAQEKGMLEAQGENKEQKSLGSDIVFYSGHQWASTDYDSDDRCDSSYGCAGVFHDQETGPDIKKWGLTSPSVRLVFISSCNGLNHNGRRLYSKLYPNAYILGWASSAPVNQFGMMGKFIAQLPDDTLLDTTGIEAIIQSWRTFIEQLAIDFKDKDKDVFPYKLGYGEPGGKVIHFYRRSGEPKTWKWSTQTHK